MVSEEDLPKEVPAYRQKMKEDGNLFSRDAQPQAESDKESKYLDTVGIRDADVLLYLGPYARYAEPKRGDAAFSVMKKSGVNFSMLVKETETGMNAYQLGMPDIAQKQLDTVIEKINALNPKVIVTSCPEDQRALGGHVPGLNAEKLTAPVKSFSAFILELINYGSLVLRNIDDRVYAYHDSDQGGSFLQDYSSPRELMKSVQGMKYIELFWSKEIAGSAGESGLLSFFKQYAFDIAKKRVAQIQGSGADIFVTDCWNAQIMLSKEYNDYGLNVLHIAEFINNRI